MDSNVGRAVLLQELLDALVEVDSAAEQLQEHLHGYRAELATARAHFAAGGSVPDLLAAKPLTAERSAKEPVRLLEAARARGQYAMYRLAAADGMNAAEIGRAWTVSRQLVSRVLNHHGNRT
ncbi:MAG TPA: hypothetical protein VIK61_11165 [Acidimicrobiia bacterium]